MTLQQDSKGALPPVAVGLVIAATGWFMLQQLAPLLRPLLLAVFLCYVIVPQFLRPRRRFPGWAALLLSASRAILIVYLLGLILQGNITLRRAKLPRLIERAGKIFAEVRTLRVEHFPS